MADASNPDVDFPAAPQDKQSLEEGEVFTPRFDAIGLVTAIVTDVADGTVLMVAHMNSEALALTLSTGIAHYYSRSRAALWKKGESSGNIQTVHEIRTDCDQDAILLTVSVSGHESSCHTGRKSCFYRRVATEDGKHTLVMTGDTPRFDPAGVY